MPRIEPALFDCSGLERGSPDCSNVTLDWLRSDTLTFELWSRSRDTVNEGFTTSDNIIDLRLKRVF